MLVDLPILSLRKEDPDVFTDHLLVEVIVVDDGRVPLSVLAELLRPRIADKEQIP